MADSNVCNFCDKEFTLKKNLYAHMRKIHDLQVEKENLIRCPKEECNFSCNFVAQLRLHVQEIHLVQMVTENIVFKSWDDFLQWKAKEEKATKSSLVKQGGSYTLKNGAQKIIFKCHRSGIFKSQSEGKRLQKSQGSNKMGYHCTAAIEVTREKSGTCSIFYFKTHFGHEMHVGFLRLCRSDREALAAKIADGVSLQKILDDTRDSIHSEDLDRIHLITRKDLNNIKRDFCLNDTQQHSSDDVSVCLWLEKMGDCVLLHKKSGESLENVDLKDVIIVLMTGFQCELLQKFGPKTVCVDTTYSTNMYKLLVTTLLVIDEFGCGIPVAFCITNRENIAVMTHFFTAVKQRAGVIHTCVFMSDDTNIFRSAWSIVMGLAENNLLCTWHVDRSWRSNLKKVNGEVKQGMVYKALRMLLQEPDGEKFAQLMDSFEQELREDEDTEVFGVYFTDHYGYRPHQWALCHRQNLGISTNMHLEAMHRVLKHCYLDGKKNNRLDRLLVVLMKLVRDKMFERLVRLYKGGNSYRIQLVHDRHKLSEKIKKDQIMVSEDGSEFKLRSHSNSAIHYTIVPKNMECDCKLTCSVCRICVHTFSCSCPDSLIKLNICKHMHAVAANYSIKRKIRIETDLKEETSAIMTHFKKENEPVISAHQREIHAKLQALASRVMSPNLSAETLATIDQQAERLLSLSSSEYYRDVSHCARNEKVEVQQASRKNTIHEKSTCEKATIARVAGSPQQHSSDMLKSDVQYDHSYCKK